MKLQEMIDTFENFEGIPYETIQPKIKQLNAYYSGQYMGEPILCLWGITNTGGLGLICDSNDFSETVDNIVSTNYPDLVGQEIEDEIELINFNSIPLSHMLK